MLGSLGHAGARRLGVAIVALAVPACGGAAPAKTSPPPPPAAAGVRLDAPLEGGARLFHTAIDEAFWVSHTPELDRVVSSGVRIEMSPAGEFRAAAWEMELAVTGDPLLGALAVPAHLGGGFVHWSRNRLFRSDSFTGALRPVALDGALGSGGIRGARGGLEAVIVFGDAGNAALRPGKDRLEPAPEAGLADFAALDARRAMRVDVLGRLATTGDGGATWIDATAQAGLAGKTLFVEPDTIAVETWQGRFVLGADGRLGPLDGNVRGGGSNKAFQLLLRGSRVDDREAWWAWRDTPPIQAAVVSGARFAPRRAVAVAPNAAGDVDLDSGELRSAVTDWPPPGLLCSAIAGRSEPLFICGWEPYQGYGAYVLRAPGGALPPVVERAFSDDGYFVADEDGALAYVGSCAVTPRLIDPNDPARVEMGTELKPSSTICVRRGPNDWVEQSVALEPGLELYGWAPRKDGTAIAIAFDPRADGLPEPTRAEPRTADAGGVRVVRLLPEIAGWSITRPSWTPYGVYMGGMRGPLGPFVERRWQAREGGSIEGWLSSPNSGGDMGTAVRAAVSIDGAGRVTVHPPPPRAAAMVTTGDHGLAVSSEGELFETLDHGVTWRAAGRSPLPPGSFGGTCSALGCALGPITRLGWGSPRVDPAVRVDPLPRPAAAPPSPVRLSCTPSGLPEPRPDDGEKERKNLSWQTGYGDMISLVREAEPTANEGAPSEGEAAFMNNGDTVFFAPQKPDPAKPSPRAPAKPGAARPRSTAPLRTHSMLFRPPFDPSAPLRRLDATGTDLEDARRSIIMPLLTPEGAVALLFIADKHELLVGPERISTLPLFEPRRYASTDGATTSGLLLGPDHALVMGEVRRRAALEDHGPAPHRPPLLLGQERDNSVRRPMALARREDGALGLLVWDGSPAEAAAIAELDRAGGTFSARTPLAPWSTAVTADDPRCRDDKRGWRAIVTIEPGRWLSLDEGALPGVELTDTGGAALVRWSKERVCVEAIDVSAQRHPEGEQFEAATLVARWQAAKGQGRGATILGATVRQSLICRLEGVKGE